MGVSDHGKGAWVSAGMAEVDATLSIGAHMQHVYPIHYGAMPEADAAVAMIGAWIRVHLS